MRIKKLAMCTDIHWGAKNNSVQHNQDNAEYLRWFISNLPGDTSHIAFLGDWFEQRNAINIHTLQFATEGARMLDALGIPVIFITGNHDLYRRHTRDVHSLDIFGEFKNFILVDKPNVVGVDGSRVLALPYLFHSEYATCYEEIQKADVVLGHLEFQGFVLTGYNTVLEHGPDHKLFSRPRKIFTGHFHKRQRQDNVRFIGNVFPTNFGDAGDIERGMCIYDVDSDVETYIDWADCPTYAKVKLSQVMDEKWKPREKMKVKCVVDVDIGYQDAQDLRIALIETHGLRDFVLEEDREAKQGLLEGDTFTVDASGLNFSSIDELVVSQLESAKGDSKVKVNVDKLIEIYKGLPIETAAAAEE